MTLGNQLELEIKTLDYYLIIILFLYKVSIKLHTQLYKNDIDFPIA